MKHGAWGNYSPFVTDKIGGTHPRTRADCARDTGLSKQQVSEVSAFYLAHGYARWEKGIIYPEPSPTPILAGELSGSPDSSSLSLHHNSSCYKASKAQWFADHPAEAVSVAEARAILREVRLRVLADYRVVAEGSQTYANEADDGSPDAADTTPGPGQDSPEDLAPTSRTPEGATCLKSMEALRA